MRRTQPRRGRGHYRWSRGRPPSSANPGLCFVTPLGYWNAVIRNPVGVFSGAGSRPMSIAWLWCEMKMVHRPGRMSVECGGKGSLRPTTPLWGEGVSPRGAERTVHTPVAGRPPSPREKARRQGNEGTPFRRPCDRRRRDAPRSLDRKSAVQGKSVKLDGARIIKKKTHHHYPLI